MSPSIPAPTLVTEIDTVQQVVGHHSSIIIDPTNVDKSVDVIMSASVPVQSTSL